MTRSARILSVLPLTALLGACGAATPRSEAPERHLGSCSLLRIEHVEREGETLYPVNSALVMLEFRPPGPAGQSSSVSTKVQIRREVEEDLRARLDTEPELICEPDPTAPGGYRLTFP